MNSIDKQKNKKKKKKRFSYFIYDFVKITGFIPTLIWMRPKTIFAGKSKRKDYKGGMLISCNHRGFLDPIAAHCVFWNRRLHCLATKNLYDTKLKNWFFTRMHCIKVDKDNFSMDSFHDAIDYLKEDKAVLIFPEGQINHEHEVMSFKAGAVLMALRSAKPIVPVYMPEHANWYSRRKAIVGDPIDVRAMCGKIPTMEKLKEVNEYVRQVEISLKELYESKYQKPKKKQQRG
jgi:1-acyl-sn-glycerol-3-phosphate acyltransferase